MIELTDAELEKIMKCPNLKYRTQSGAIVKGSDVKEPTSTPCKKIFDLCNDPHECCTGQCYANQCQNHNF